MSLGGVEEVYRVDAFLIGEGWCEGPRVVGWVGLRVGEGFGLGDFAGEGVRLGDVAGGGSGGFEFLAAVFFLEVAEFVFHLHFEFVAGASELHHEATDLSSDFGQTLGAEENEGQEDDESVIAEVHEFL